MMKGRIRALALMVVCVLLTTAFVCTAKQTRDFTSGISGVSSAIDAGITTVHALRVSGDVAPETALRLARGALDVNSISREIVGGMLDMSELNDAGRTTLVDQLDRLIPRATALLEDGTLHVKNGKVKIIVFGFSAGGLAALKTLRAQLGADIGSGLNIEIDEGTHRLLRSTADTINSNETRLNAAIRELETLGNSARA